MSVLDADMRQRHQWRNYLHSALLLTGLAILVAVPAFLMSGATGILMALFVIGAFATFGPRLPIAALMRAFKAREVPADGRSGLIVYTHELARRASLPRPPRLFVIPSQALNAFATGTKSDAAIALTSGLINALQPREIAAVIAHEISHIRNNDLWIMGLADAMSRFTLVLSYTGLFFAAVNLVTVFFGGEATVPWLAVAILYVAPALSSILQLALSRAREYDADLEGVLLTGDPEALASALRKIERLTGSVWQDLNIPTPGRRIPQPSLLRTHPKTEDRIARLAELRRPGHGYRLEPMQIDTRQPVVVFSLIPHAVAAPRYRFPGVWY